jgi:hypothetical protein
MRKTKETCFVKYTTFIDAYLCTKRRPRTPGKLSFCVSAHSLSFNHLGALSLQSTLPISHDTEMKIKSHVNRAGGNAVCRWHS